MNNDGFEEYTPKKNGSDFEEYSIEDKEEIHPILQAIQDYGRSAIRGGLKGLMSVGKMTSDLMPEDFMGTSTQGEGLDRFNRHLENELGVGNTTGASTIEGTMERAVPLALPIGKLGGLPRIGRSLLGGFAGEFTEEAGGGPLMQAGAEIVGSSAPGAIVNKILPGNKPSSLLGKLFPKKNIDPKKIAASSGREYTEESFVKALRDRGFSDEQITPLIQSEMKQKVLGKLASKGEETQKILKGSETAVGDLYKSLKNHPLANAQLSQPVGRQMLRKLNESYMELPSRLKNFIKEDYDKFLNSKKTPKDMMLLNQHINDVRKSVPNSKQVGRLKGAIEFGMDSVNKELGEEFKLVNDIKSRFAGIEQVLSTKQFDNWMSKAKLGAIPAGVGWAAYSGDVEPLALAVAGAAGMEVLSHHLRNALLKPKYQDLGRKFASAIKQNKNVAATSIIRNMGKELAKDKVDPEIVGSFLTFEA